MLAAIEVYNKPNFAYREETFSILAVNAWELLLKARILQLSKNRIASILEYERRTLADGTKSEKRYRKRNRSGNHLSVGLFKALDLLNNEYAAAVPGAVRENLELLCEVRDNAIHLSNKSSDLCKVVRELGTACLRNYIAATREWFATDISEENFLLMPIGFVEGGEASAAQVGANEKRVTEFLRGRILEGVAEESAGYDVALRMDLKFSRSRAEDAVPVVVTNDPSATRVTLTEEDLRDRYPWDYRTLTAQLKKRYTDFKQNAAYHEIRRPLEEDERYCRTRYLDPRSTTGVPKRFYNPNILREFDKYYARPS
jgi:hypothetical protein